MTMLTNIWHGVEVLMTNEKLRELFDDLSLDEKIGQLLQVAGNLFDEDSLTTGLLDYFKITDEELKTIGSILSISGAEKLKKIQDECMAKQPHHIPQIFMLDVINGFETIYPVPLAQGATFNPDMAEKLAAMAARECSAAGVHVTFSPMVDLVRDARWGRVMESTGEDAFLNGQLGAAMVRGYQGDDIKAKGNIAACVKHFAGYGGGEGGRDYDTVEVSERTLRDEFLPAYEECIKAGARLVMTSFNTLNRVPSSANKWLMKDVLRDEMKFDGVLISDYGAIKEMVNHNIAKDEKEAGRLSIRAGVDIEMMSLCYSRGLKELLDEGKVTMEMIDTCAWRVLLLKNELGLFENPYKDANAEDEKKYLLCEEHRKLAREAAVDSFVLLKNDNALPLAKDTKEKVAFIGPYIDSHEVFGSWSFPQKVEECVTIRQGIAKNVPGLDAVYSEGCYLFDRAHKMKNGVFYEYDRANEEKMIAEAVEIAKQVDKVVLCIGEHAQQTGEATSRATINVSNGQIELIRKIAEVNPNIISVVFTGRPILLEEISKLSKAVLVTWFPGTESGNAIAKVLFGDEEPKGRLPMSFPYVTGQMPCYYNRFPSGRPNNGTLDQSYVMGYIDQIDKMLYPFGSGMGYTEFAYGEVVLSAKEMTKGGTLTATVKLTNTGKRTGTETVQMYIADLYGSVVRPVKSLKGFKKVTLSPGESQDVSFEVKEEMFRFHNIDMEYVSEPGTCKVMIGHDSEIKAGAEFEMI